MYDVIVIGGGYIGTSIGYYLAKAGVKTLLLEEDDIGVKASGGNYGCIQVQDSNLGKSLEMTLEGYPLAMNLEKELNMDLELVDQYSLIFGETDAEMEELMKLYQGKKDAGLDVVLHSQAEIRKMEPYLNADSIQGGSGNMQGALYPFKLLYGFLKRGKEHGLEVRLHTKVVDFLEDGNKVVGVKLASGEEISCQKVVLATGAYTEGLGKKIGLDLPVHFVKGEAFVTEAVAPRVFSYLSSAAFFTDVHGEEGEAGCSLALRQSPTGHIYVGETAVDVGSDPYKMTTLPSAYHIKEMSRKAIGYLPFLKDVKVLRSWAVASPATADFEPILKEEKEGSVIVASGFKSCVVITCWVGEYVKNLILN